jgi:hypothetical protein
MGTQSLVVDNSPGDEYFNKLTKMVNGYVAHVDVPRDPVESLFHRNVTTSVEFCRQSFLASDADVMVIIESDVIPPVDLLERFAVDIEHLSQSRSMQTYEGERAMKPWGILGGLYYPGFHDYIIKGLVGAHHVLSGCTAYSRELLQKYAFRYDPTNLGPFPDAIICHDAGGEFSFWNDHGIVCDHLHRGDGGRMSCLL